MFGACKVCVEKDRRIADLKEEIRYHRSLFKSPDTSPAAIELNTVLDGASNQTEALPVVNVPDNDVDERAEAEREFDRVISGNY